MRQWEPEINRYIESRMKKLLEFAPDLTFILHMSKIQKSLTDGGCKFDFLFAKIDSDEHRTYETERKPPERNSYASSIAKKYGISFEDLVRNQ